MLFASLSPITSLDTHSEGEQACSNSVVTGSHLRFKSAGEPSSSRWFPATFKGKQSSSAVSDQRQIFGPSPSVCSGKQHDAK
ncbi:unnamed protein product [Soboliphyme baturini]|uniref:Secreted protein n=1 Tax=Soboliphyme baturini TaxID=241478 RepID=A0A183J1Z8_9BILA|nr:unnamed protein product [Soboliphyme baturini]